MECAKYYSVAGSFSDQRCAARPKGRGVSNCYILATNRNADLKWHYALKVLVYVHI